MDALYNSSIQQDMRVSFSVKQNGNRVEIYGGSQTIFFEVEGASLPPLHDFSFAVWTSCPLPCATGSTSRSMALWIQL